MKLPWWISLQLFRVGIPFPVCFQPFGNEHKGLPPKNLKVLVGWQCATPKLKQGYEQALQDNF
jgi:hypothetical protein